MIKFKCVLCPNYIQKISPSENLCLSCATMAFENSIEIDQDFGDFSHDHDFKEDSLIKQTRSIYNYEYEENHTKSDFKQFYNGNIGNQLNDPINNGLNDHISMDCVTCLLEDSNIISSYNNKNYNNVRMEDRVSGSTSEFDNEIEIKNHDKTLQKKINHKHKTVKLEPSECRKIKNIIDKSYFRIKA